jgi:hypothetical protein
LAVLTSPVIRSQGAENTSGNERVTRDEIPDALKRAKSLAVEQWLAGAQTVRPPVIHSHPGHNVVGVGIGRKITAGRLTAEPSVRIYVERKIAEHLIRSDHILPKSIGGVATDIVETGRFRAQLPGPLLGQTRLRPANPGCSIGFQFPDAQAGELMAGTFGALVTAGGVYYLLSNNHVLANENALAVGTPIFQPGLLDNGDPSTDQIAKLSNFVPLAPNQSNKVDCALAEILDVGAVAAAILPDVGQLSGADPIDATDSMHVEKTGRATGYTTGAVYDVSASVPIEYGLGLLTFADQVLIHGGTGPFSNGGDSGALVVDQASGRATGLLIGGSPQFAIANHIEDVLQALNVTLVC